MNIDRRNQNEHSITKYLWTAYSLRQFISLVRLAYLANLIYIKNQV